MLNAIIGTPWNDRDTMERGLSKYYTSYCYLNLKGWLPTAGQTEERDVHGSLFGSTTVTTAIASGENSRIVGSVSIFRFLSVIAPWANDGKKNWYWRCLLWGNNIMGRICSVMTDEIARHKCSSDLHISREGFLKPTSIGHSILVLKYQTRCFDLKKKKEKNRAGY